MQLCLNSIGRNCEKDLFMMKNNNSTSETRGKIISCKAAICRKPREPLVIEEIQVHPPKAYEVRIKIICTSLCHTDVTFWTMDPSPMSLLPKIFGHEAVGIVESVGENAEEFEEGDTVLPVFNPTCKECRDCKSSRSNICSKFPIKDRSGDMPRDNTSRFRDMNGEILHHFVGVSSFVEYTVVDVAHLVKISPLIPVDKACLLSCGVSTGVGAAWKEAEVEEGSTVAIFGLGTIGLAVAEGARLRKASKIIGVDMNPDKFEIGKEFGVTDFINPKTCGEKSVSEVIKEMTEGGADYCFECIGLASLMQTAFSSTREGSGKTVVLGLDMLGAPLSLNTLELLTGRSLVGSVFGGIKAKTDIPLLVTKYLDKELNLDKFITHQVSFEDINKAFDLLQQRQKSPLHYMDG